MPSSRSVLVSHAQLIDAAADMKDHDKWVKVTGKDHRTDELVEFRLPVVRFLGFYDSSKNRPVAAVLVPTDWIISVKPGKKEV